MNLITSGGGRAGGNPHSTSQRGATVLRVYEIVEPGRRPYRLKLNDADAASYGDRATLVDPPKQAAEPEPPPPEVKQHTPLNKMTTSRGRGRR